MRFIDNPFEQRKRIVPVQYVSNKLLIFVVNFSDLGRVFFFSVHRCASYSHAIRNNSARVQPVTRYG
jgi:hypothetical protein